MQMYRRLGIIQPGKIGDIVICLPIAKWYHDRGYEVIWPVDKNIIDNFLGYVDYVQFIPIEFDCIAAHLSCIAQHCNKIIDLAFTLANANQVNTDFYLKENTKWSFDEFKYQLAEVPFEEKWNLVIKRDHSREREVLEKFHIAEKKFVVVQENSSDCIRKVQWDNPDVRRIDITPVTGSVFDWIGVLEKAQQHILIESSLTNLIDQLNIKVDRHILLEKNGYYGNILDDGHPKGLPRFRLNWNRI